MNDRQLHSFLLAADSGSFSKAAQAAFISTPALVQQINLLEKNIGFPLFYRTHQGISLTPAGGIFYDASREILQTYEDACARGREISRTENDSLTIAYPPEQFPPFILKAYETFLQDFPNTAVTFLPMPYNEHIAKIAGGKADCSILAEPRKECLGDLIFTKLFEDTYSFCMRPEHPLADRSLLKADDLTDGSILCGNYYYMKYPFHQQLSAVSSRIQVLDSEYDMSIRSKVLLTDDIFAIHSRWSSQYQSFLTVVPSDLPAGPVGAVCRKNPSPAVTHFLSYF